jgi:hypothetical protein
MYNIYILVAQALGVLTYLVDDLPKNYQFLRGG